MHYFFVVLLSSISVGVFCQPYRPLGMSLWHAKPLPSSTPNDVVNIILEAGHLDAGEVVASVIAADTASATYSLKCAECVLDYWKNGLVVTQGHSSMQWSWTEPTTRTTSVYSHFHNCTFSGTAAPTAICVQSWSSNIFSTITYDGHLDTFTHSEFGVVTLENMDLGLNGFPPYVPIKITAGLESLSVFRAAAPTTSVNTVESTGSATPGQLPTTTSSPTPTTTGVATRGKIGSYWAFAVATCLLAYWM